MKINEILTEAVKQRLDPKCWKGKHKEGTKIKGGVRVNNCVPNEGVAEGAPQPGESSGAPKKFGPDAKIETRQMTVKQLIASVPGLPYYNNVVDDWDAKDYSWGVTKKVIEYATYLKEHPESLSQLPPILVLNGKFEDGAHRVSAIWLLQQRMDPKNPLWANAELNVQFVKQGVAEELGEEFDLIETIIENLAKNNGVDAEVIWEDLESLSDDELYVFATTTTITESEAWQKANKKDKTDGMSQKAVNSYRRAHPGSKLKTAVTTKPGKLKKGSKASKRRKSYCSRSRGQMKMHSISCAKTPDKAICKARRRWNC